MPQVENYCLSEEQTPVFWGRKESGLSIHHYNGPGPEAVAKPEERYPVLVPTQQGPLPVLVP